MSNKMKPHKGLLKRVKVAGNGNVRRKQAGKVHLMSSKAGKRRRNLGATVAIAKSDVKRVRKLLGMG